MTQEELIQIWNSLDIEQKEKAEELYKKRRTQLFKWHNLEERKISEKLKKEGRLRKGLDANNKQAEIIELSIEYQRRFNALAEECICEIISG